jgi:hypothetical protein
MCPGRQVNRCGGSPCTAVTATCTEQAAVGFDSQRRAALSLTPLRADPPRTAGTSKVSLRRAVDAV